MRNPFTNARIVAVGADPDKYHADKGGPIGSKDRVMSRSELLKFAKCPSEWRAGIPEKDTEATEWGTLIDIKLLTPGDFSKRVAVHPDTYPGKLKADGSEPKWTRAANYCKEWEANHEGKLIISESKDRDANWAVLRLQQDPYIRNLLDGAQFQVWCEAEYTDKATGITIRFKTLMDFVPNKNHKTEADDTIWKSLGDLKTGRNITPRKFNREIFDHGYHWQAAISTDIYTLITGEDRCEWRFILSKNVAPFQPGRRVLESEFLEEGRRNYRGALALYCRCLATDKWPSIEDACDSINGWVGQGLEPWMIMSGPGDEFTFGKLADWMSDKPESKDDGMPVTP